MKIHKEKFTNLELKKHTIHTSKGKEADYVIVLGLQSGNNGFPSEKTTNPLLEALLPTPEDFEFAEERRLFYVAITRARKRSYLVADMTTSSAFVNELINENYDIELNEFEIAQEQRIFQKFHCIECETGVMQPKVNQKDKTTFFGCSHFSLCKHTENGCSKCGGQLMRINEGKVNYKVCSCCDNWIPLCTQCGGDMKYRAGPSGQFWGCSHYFGNTDALSCTYTINKAKPPKGLKDIVNASNNAQQKTSTKSNNTEDVWGDKKFTDRQDAYTYAKKLAMKRKSTVNVIEGDGFWSVELRK